MEWLSENAWQAWTAVAMALGVAELLNLDLVLLMLAIGAVAGVVTAVLGLPIAVQVLAAAGTSVALLALVRPSMVARLHSGPELKHGTAALIGHEAFVVDEVSNRGGTVKIGGETWTARPYDEHSVITPGSRVEVFEIRGATAYVHPAPELEP